MNSLRHLQTKLLRNDKHLEDYLLLIIGKNSVNTFAKISIPVKQVGMLNESGLIRAYQAADVFISPSIEDSGPLMVNQAMMCGTPVVAFKTGVALDLIDGYETGYAADLKDSKELSDGIYAVGPKKKVLPGP